MRIETSKGTQHIVEWIDSPIQNENKLYIHMVAEMTLVDAVTEFDGLEWVQRYDENQGDKRFEGYNRLALARIDGDKLTIMMVKGEA